MSVEEQFRAQTLELDALKNRVRNFRQTKHWQTDGEWKESVLRTVLSRHLPRHLEPLRGFITDGEQSSRQIDVLVYDNTKPVLFRSGDLVFVTPDAVAGIIEVKSTINTLPKLRAALQPLASNIAMLRRYGNTSAFAGLFVFDTTLKDSDLAGILGELHKVSRKDLTRVVDLVTLGSNAFILNWEGLLPDGVDAKGRRWHAYHLPSMAPGYFINNVIHWAAPLSVQNHMRAWFPPVPKEVLALKQDYLEQEAQDLGYGVVEPGGKWGSL
jgi:hypothetical protein